MASLASVVDYTNELLQIDAFRDYCPNGLQVQGRQEIGHLVGGVTASEALINAAIEQQADALLVHHGYFWKGEDQTITGMKYERVRRLLDAGIGLLAYHLPLDAHAVYGNNAQLALRMGWQIDGGFAAHGTHDIAMHGHLAEPCSATALASALQQTLDREPLLVAGHDREIKRIGWCTGAAQGYLQQAAALGLDAYVSGEISEQTWHEAHELGMVYYAAGHHATERFGVLALGKYLSEHFGLKFTFIDIENPV